MSSIVKTIEYVFFLDKWFVLTPFLENKNGDDLSRASYIENL
ncbi:hypothetical protein [Methanobacterium sp. SMA-27]|nr:hypothetical protein [Methanobacterium sp. SMA-27]